MYGYLELVSGLCAAGILGYTLAVIRYRSFAGEEVAGVYPPTTTSVGRPCLSVVLDGELRQGRGDA